MAKVHTIILTKNGEQVSYSREPAAVIGWLKDGQYVITIRRGEEPRSLDQNSLMWLWFTCMESETGTPKQDIHDYYCRKFLRKTIKWRGRRQTITGGTSSLNKERMTWFLDQVQADAASEFGIRLPLPEDMYFEQFYETYRNG